MDVEVDRCIDENSASNLKHIAFLSTKLHRPKPKIHRSTKFRTRPTTDQTHRFRSFLAGDSELFIGQNLVVGLFVSEASLKARTAVST